MTAIPDGRPSRRTFLKAAAACAAVPLASSGPIPSISASASRAPSHRVSSVRLGVASYSLRNLPLDAAIAAVKALGTTYVNLKSFHMPYELSSADLKATRAKIEGAGLQIVGGGTITFDQDSDDGVRKHFDYARGAGMPLIVATCHPELLPRIERFAKSYDIKVAIHNHGPEDKHFPSPYEALKYVWPMDARMGLCIDVGHTVRTGTDVVKAIADAGPRLLDMHVKDLRDLKDARTQCIVGEGSMPISAIFKQLDAIGYSGYANLEYEIEPDNPLPGMQRSFAYMRGVLAGLASSQTKG